MIIITFRYHRLSGSLNIIFICLYMITIFGGSRNNRFVLARVEYKGLYKVQYRNAQYRRQLMYPVMKTANLFTVQYTRKCQEPSTEGAAVQYG